MAKWIGSIGQLRATGGNYDYEERSAYIVDVVVSDGKDAEGGRATVIILISDAEE